MSSKSNSKPKSILITGGASGIGLAITRYFAGQPEGHSIAILDVNAATGEAVAAALAAEFPRRTTISFHACDVSSWDEQARVFERVYREHGNALDVVVANAGVSEQGATTLVKLQSESGAGSGERGEEGPRKPSVKTVEVNLLGVVYSVNLAVHYMDKKPHVQDGTSRGSIICTASNAGLYPFPIAPLYAASKFGVIGLVWSTAKVIERAGIQINALAPAVLDTNIAPDKDLFKHMIVTPMETLIRGVDQFLADPTVSGAVAEVHGDKVTIRPPHEFVDEDSRRNIETFWKLGYA
ncbi:NAD(P)-binding protein [Canariomyces notabilis]|uniref:NAD(P)-binding protein n=1 Tax=Canariomyces notabilis TaxID=2074819 RepID=A0AAN6TET4_9PEZI|nr:NAD(P)-binding protein [Canariomyces arenarius]